MRMVGGLLQVIFFLVLFGIALLAAGIMGNRLPLSEPPGWGTRLATYLNTNVAETVQDSPFPELRPRRYDAPPALLFDVTRRAVEQLRWETVLLDNDKKEIGAVVTTKLWGFKDDVSIRIQPAQPSGSWLMIRSSSRTGKGDLGANTRHVIDLVEMVDATVPKQAIVQQ
jgi:uncharacterized protein (DUF1499 family)